MDCAVFTMKILLGIVFIYAVCYVRTQWIYRTENYVKTTTEHTLPYNNTLTKTENTNLTNASSTSATITTLKDRIESSILTINETETAAVLNTENSSMYIHINDEDNTEDRLHYYQLSDITTTQSNYNCTEKNERYSLPETCDEYIECKNGVATSLQCLDGLHFDTKNSKRIMPCQYSLDVPCKNKMSPKFQTRECPQEFGYFKLEDKYNCSSFRICEFGVGYDFNCPNGLAFRSDNLRCDWPHKVPECDAEGYAGIVCPDKRSYHFFRSPTDCQVYYTCNYGVPRRHVCEKYKGYDKDSNVCAPADRIRECDPQLKLAAKEHRRLRYLENINSGTDYDDGDGYLQDRSGDLSFYRRVRRAKIISYPTYKLL